MAIGVVYQLANFTDGTFFNCTNFATLPVDNGAPLRLASPIKLGYKQSKWVTKVNFASQIPQGGKGYWEEQGYEWFAGI